MPFASRGGCQDILTAIFNTSTLRLSGAPGTTYVNKFQ